MYHGIEFVSTLYKDDRFGNYITRIKIQRNKGLRTSNYKILKHNIKSRYKLFYNENEKKIKKEGCVCRNKVEEN